MVVQMSNKAVNIFMDSITEDRVHRTLNNPNYNKWFDKVINFITLLELSEDIKILKKIERENLVGLFPSSGNIVNENFLQFSFLRALRLLCSKKVVKFLNNDRAREYQERYSRYKEATFSRFYGASPTQMSGHFNGKSPSKIIVDESGDL